MNDAIEKAIKGGYKIGKSVNTFEQSESHYSDCWYSDGNFDFLIPEILLDPLFWQALGKAEGWEDYRDKRLEWVYYGNIYGWQAVWHRFIDWIAEGKDAESFFNNLSELN